MFQINLPRLTFLTINSSYSLNQASRLNMMVMADQDLLIEIKKVEVAQKKLFLPT